MPLQDKPKELEESENKRKSLCLRPGNEWEQRQTAQTKRKRCKYLQPTFLNGVITSAPPSIVIASPLRQTY